MTAAFLSAVAALTWQSDHLVTGAGAPQYPAVNERRETWELLPSPGLSLTQATYQTLASSTANGDGSFTDATGARWRLDDAPNPGWATLVVA